MLDKRGIDWQKKDGQINTQTEENHAHNSEEIMREQKNVQLQQTTTTLTNDTLAKQKATEAVLTALNKAGIEVVQALVAAEVKRMSDGTPSLAWIILCTLIPPFFLPVLGCLPTPLKSRLEKRVIVVESIIFSRFIHFGSFFLLHSRLSEERR